MSTTDDTTDNVAQPTLKHYVNSIMNSGENYGRNLLPNKLSVEEHIVYDSHKTASRRNLLHICNARMLVLLYYILNEGWSLCI